MTTPNELPLTEREINEFIELSKKATPGPWEWNRKASCESLSLFAGKKRIIDMRCADCGGPTTSGLDDERFIAAARNIADRLVSTLAAANERIADYEQHYARERYVNELADYRTMEQNWKEREAALEQQLAEREASIQRLSAILDSYTE